MTSPIPAGLEGPDRDAYMALTNVFHQYGLDSLAPTILDFIQQGYSSDTITYLLQQTDAYKQRFKGNELRAKAGLPVLSPADYLSTEESYRQVLASGGMPVGFYDSPDDFAAWIGSDVSPAEVKSRVDIASQYVAGLDPSVRQMLQEYHGVGEGDLAAYFLDQKRSLPLLQRQSAQVEIGAAGLRQGLHLSAQDADYWAGLGVTPQQAQQGLSQAAEVLPRAQQLASIYGQNYSQQDAEQEFLGDLASARRKRQLLAQQENENFAGGMRSFSTGSSNTFGSDTGQY